MLAARSLMRPLISPVGLAIALFAAGLAAAETWVDRCAEADTAWLLGGNQPHVRIYEHNRRHGSDQQADAEVLRFACPPGAAAWWWRPTPPAAVIDELTITVETALTTTPLGIAAEVVLPRSRNPETGRPERLVVRPAISNSWRESYPARGQRFDLDGLPGAVERALRMRRLSSRTATLDGRGAYVVGVGLVASGASSPVTVEVTEVRLEGRIAPLRDAETSGPAVAATEPASDTTAGGDFSPTDVELTSTGWRIDGREFFLRARRVRGESPERLLALGFNAVWLDQQPTREQLAAFGAVGLRVLCPCPPDPDMLGESGSSVLAWTLQDQKDQNALDAGLAEVDRLRSLPRKWQRPVLAEVIGGYSEWSRVLDGLLVGPRGSRLGNAERTAVFNQVGATAAPGTPLIATVPLEIDAKAQQQLDALLGDGVASAWLASYEIEATLRRALAAGVGGVAYVSHQGLESPEASAEIIGELIGLENERLRLIEPWLTAPKQPAMGDNPLVTLVRNGARLTLGGGSATSATTTTGVPGRGYLLTPAGIRPATNVTTSSTGGADRLEAGDPRIARSLAQYLASRDRSAARRQTDLARKCVSESVSLTPASRKQAEKLLTDSEFAAARGDRFTAFLLASQALDDVQQAERQHVAIAQQPANVHESSPLALLPTTLTEHFRFTQLIAAAPRGPNRLQGGSFEGVGELRRFGWANRGGSDQQQGPVELLPGSPIHGERRLRLSGESASLVGSPPIPIAAGELVEITGWVKVTSEDRGGVVVSDTLGGEELALRIGAEDAEDYQLFRMLRSATSDTTFRIRFKPYGAAEVDLDGVMVRPVALPSSVATRAATQPK